MRIGKHSMLYLILKCNIFQTELRSKSHNDILQHDESDQFSMTGSASDIEFDRILSLDLTIKQGNSSDAHKHIRK